MPGTTAAYQTHSFCRGQGCCDLCWTRGRQAKSELMARLLHTDCGLDQWAHAPWVQFPVLPPPLPVSSSLSPLPHPLTSCHHLLWAHWGVGILRAVGVRVVSVQVSSLLPPHSFWGESSCCYHWWETPLHAQPAHCPQPDQRKEQITEIKYRS